MEFSRGFRVIGSAAAVSVGLIACAGGSEGGSPETDTPTTAAVEARASDADNGSDISTFYNEGTLVVEYTSDYELVSIVESCEGPEAASFVSERDRTAKRNEVPNEITTDRQEIPGDHRCNDGQITEADYPNGYVYPG